MRLGLLYPLPDPIHPANWSGTPWGLAAGLRECGADVVPISAKVPPGIHEVVAGLSRITGKRGAVADRTMVRQLARTWALRRDLERAGSLDGVVAMGTEMYDLPSIRRVGIPMATYDDGTLLQMWQHPHSDIRGAGFPEREVRRWIARQSRSSQAADLCCSSTEWARRSLVEDYGVAPSRTSVVGIGHSPIRGLGRVERDWSRPTFLFVGVDWRRKNGPAVLRAFSQVRRVVPDAQLHVVGRHPHLSSPGVHGHGYLPRADRAAQELLRDLYATATCFVLPSQFEPAGIAYLEAASAGLPVIATTEGGAPELLGDGAVAVHPDDDAAIAEAMVRMAQPSVAMAIGRAAADAAENSTWQQVASRILRAMPGPAPRTPEARGATSCEPSSTVAP